MPKGNGGLKAVTYVLSGLVIGMAIALVNAYAQASHHISVTAAQEMVDRGDNTIKERLDRIDKKLDALDDLIRQGQSP